MRRGALGEIPEADLGKDRPILGPVGAGEVSDVHDHCGPASNQGISGCHRHGGTGGKEAPTANDGTIVGKPVGMSHLARGQGDYRGQQKGPQSASHDPPAV